MLLQLIDRTLGCIEIIAHHLFGENGQAFPGDWPERDEC